MNSLVVRVREEIVASVRTFPGIEGVDSVKLSRLIVVGAALIASGTTAAWGKAKPKPVQEAHAVSVFRSGSTCTKFLGIMGLEKGMDELKKAEDSTGAIFSNHSGQLATFPSPLSVMVLIDQHLCDAQDFSPDTAPESEMLKGLKIKAEWHDGHVRRPAENAMITQKMSTLKEIFQNLRYDIIVPSDGAPIVDHLLLTFSAQGTQLGSLDLHF
jgi:hypothetical protein